MDAVDRLVAKLTRVVVPSHVRHQDGELVRVKTYTYTRRGGGTATATAGRNDLGAGSRVAAKPLSPGTGTEVTLPFPQEMHAESSFVDKIDIADQRKDASVALDIDAAKLDHIADVVGIDKTKIKSIKLRFRNLHVVGSQGVTSPLGDGNYRVVVGVKPNKTSPGAHYVANNSLVHEMRHVAQMQHGNTTSYDLTEAKAEHTAANLQHAEQFGYMDMEIEAQLFGRLAWEGDPAKKPTYSVGADHPYEGQQVWAMSLSDTGEAYVPEDEPVPESNPLLDLIQSMTIGGKKPSPPGQTSVPSAVAEMKGPGPKKWKYAIVAAAKTVNFHSEDHQYNEHTLATLAKVVQEMKEEMATADEERKKLIETLLKQADEIIAAYHAQTKTPSKDYGKVARLSAKLERI